MMNNRIVYTQRSIRDQLKFQNESLVSVCLFSACLTRNIGI